MTSASTKLLFLLACACCLLFAQSQPAAEAKADPAVLRLQKVLTMAPDEVVATVDGNKIRAADIQVILRSMAPAAQEAAMRDPKSFFEQYGLMRRLSALAEKAGLDKQTPVRERLAYNRMLTLAEAQLQAKESEIDVSPEEVRQFYEKNQDMFATVRVKVIYIPFSPNAGSQPPGQGKKILSEAEAKAKAEKLYQELKAGADFVKLVREHSEDQTSASKDGDFGTLRRSDRLPEEVKAAVFALKAGQISAPVRQPNGYYIFRAEESGVEPLERVQQQLITDLRNAHFNEWVQSTQKSVEIKIENEALAVGAAK